MNVLDHIIALGEGRRWVLRSYARYYNEMRTHRSFNKNFTSFAIGSADWTHHRASTLADFISGKFGFMTRRLQQAA